MYLIFFAYGTLGSYETLLAETWGFFLEMTFLIHDLFKLQFIQVYLRYRELQIWRKELLQKWMEVWRPEPKPPVH